MRTEEEIIEDLNSIKEEYIRLQGQFEKDLFPEDKIATLQKLTICKYEFDKLLWVLDINKSIED